MDGIPRCRRLVERDFCTGGGRQGFAWNMAAMRWLHRERQRTEGLAEGMDGAVRSETSEECRVARLSGGSWEVVRGADRMQRAPKLWTGCMTCMERNDGERRPVEGCMLEERFVVVTKGCCTKVYG